MFDAAIRRAATLRYSRASIVKARSVAPTNDQAPRVSVVIPCYNYGQYLEDCATSVLTQHGVDVDVTIVDDCSTDGSRKIVEALVQRDPRVRAIYHDTNQGHIRTYNEGLAHVEGDYVVLLSADDMLTPGSLVRASAVFAAFPTVGLVYGGAQCISNDHREAPATTPVTWTVWKGDQWVADRCRSGRNALLTPSAIMRTSVFRAIGGSYRADLPHAGDFEMWMRAASAADVVFIGGTDQAFYRTHSDNMSTSTYRGLLRDLEERHRVFEVTLGPERGHGAQENLSAARTALATEAMRYALDWSARNIEPDGPISHYIDFATSVAPSKQVARQIAAVSRLQGKGDRSLIANAEAHLWRGRASLEWALHWQLWRRTGL